MLLEKTKESIYDLLDSLRFANVFYNIMFSTDSVNKKKGVMVRYYNADKQGLL